MARHLEVTEAAWPLMGDGLIQCLVPGAGRGKQDPRLTSPSEDTGEGGGLEGWPLQSQPWSGRVAGPQDATLDLRPCLTASPSLHSPSHLQGFLGASSFRPPAPQAEGPVLQTVLWTTFLPGQLVWLRRAKSRCSGSRRWAPIPSVIQWPPRPPLRPQASPRACFFWKELKPPQLPFPQPATGQDRKA